MRTRCLLSPGPPFWGVLGFRLGRELVKEAAEPETGRPAYNLVGSLYLAADGQLSLSVPNSIVRGVFSAMSEPGAIPAPGPVGSLTARVVVLTANELARIGGPSRISERGKQYRYSLGRWVELESGGSVAKAWGIRVHSPELQTLRRSYGLSSLPEDGQGDFHIVVAVRGRGVLGRNETSKAT